MKHLPHIWQFIVAGMMLIAVGAASAHAGMSERTVLLDGLDRSYLLYAPDRMPSGSRPLVLVLHGGGGTHSGLLRQTKGVWNQLADRHGFIVVYPNADRKIWDFGEGLVSTNRRRRVNDLAFFEQVITEVMGAYPIDQQRIFAAGISRGGQAAWFPACKLPGRFRAIAVISMPLPAFLLDDCQSAPPTGVVLMNGTADPLVPYDGGQIRVFRRNRGAVLSTEQTIRFWRQRNGCDREPDARTVIDRPGDETTTYRTDWTKCAGAPVTLYRIEGGGHSWPNGRSRLRERLVGPFTRDIDGAMTGWAFFSQF